MINVGHEEEAEKGGDISGGEGGAVGVLEEGPITTEEEEAEEPKEGDVEEEEEEDKEELVGWRRQKGSFVGDGGTSSHEKEGRGGGRSTKQEVKLRAPSGQDSKGSRGLGRASWLQGRKKGEIQEKRKKTISAQGEVASIFPTSGTGLSLQKKKMNKREGLSRDEIIFRLFERTN